MSRSSTKHGSPNCGLAQTDTSGTRHASVTGMSLDSSHIIRWFRYSCRLVACAQLGLACGGNVASSPTSAGSGGTPGTGGSSASGGVVITNSTCKLPVSSGNCDAYMQRYYFDATLGRCQSFVFGGCGGNENRFSTLMDCVTACDPTGLDRCNYASDCAIGSTGCCGTCEPTILSDFKAMTTEYAAMPNCLGVACGACPPYEGLANYANFGVQCVDHRCLVYDIRETGAATCAADSDCRLRSGLGCCERCDGTGIWVAVNQDPATQAAFCDTNVTCGKCAVLLPTSLRALCVAGRCQVVANP